MGRDLEAVKSMATLLTGCMKNGIDEVESVVPGKGVLLTWGKFHRLQQRSRTCRLR